MSSKFRYHIKSGSPEETQAIGLRLAAQIPKNTAIALYGDLAAGKTTLIQGICRGLHADQEATSPTFTLINEYHADIPVFHFDCYRIKHPDEIIMLGFEEYLEAGGIVLIEWPEKITRHLPDERMEMFLSYVDRHTRNIEIASPFELELP